MKRIIEGPPEAGAEKPPLRRSLLWFALLWMGGLAATAVIAYALRALII